MRVGVIQSSYLPWRGYFDFIASVDVFVFHDDIQYTKGDWRNRNVIKTPSGPKWITVPVHYKEVGQTIADTVIDRSTNWPRKHLAQITENYRSAPFLADALGLLSSNALEEGGTLSQLNIELTRRICGYLGITTPLMSSTEFNLVGTKTVRLIDLLIKLQADTYLSGPSADAYLDKDAFRESGLRLEYKSYSYGPYTQLWGDFNGTVSIIDLIANCGHNSINHISSLAPNQTIVE